MDEAGIGFSGSCALLDNISGNVRESILHGDCDDPESSAGASSGPVSIRRACRGGL